YFHHDDKAFGLLKFRIRSKQGEVDTHYEPNYDGRRAVGVYRIRRPEATLLRHDLYTAVVSSDEIDTFVVNRLFERVEEIIQRQGDIQAYEATTKTVRNVRLAQITQIEKSNT